MEYGAIKIPLSIHLKKFQNAQILHQIDAIIGLYEASN